MNVKEVKMCSVIVLCTHLCNFSKYDLAPVGFFFLVFSGVRKFNEDLRIDCLNPNEFDSSKL